LLFRLGSQSEQLKVDFLEISSPLRAICIIIFRLVLVEI
jgi:hypothetical protein